MLQRFAGIFARFDVRLKALLGYRQPKLRRAVQGNPIQALDLNFERRLAGRAIRYGREHDFRFRLACCFLNCFPGRLAAAAHDFALTVHNHLRGIHAVRPEKVRVIVLPL
jgi:hypothetical protein